MMPQATTSQSSDFLDLLSFGSMGQSVLTIIAMVSLIFGIVQCFAGYKVTKVVFALCGFCLGAAIGYAIGYEMGDADTAIITLFLGGLILAILSFFLYRAYVFLLSASISGVIFYFMLDNVAAALILGMIVGIVALFLVKPMIIISTSFSGASSIVTALTLMDMEIDSDMQFFATIALAAFGIAVQFYTNKKKTPAPMAPASPVMAEMPLQQPVAAPISSTQSCMPHAPTDL